ncbi:MAG: Gfo/Idh/MocA family oxidoreductase [Microbacteriaceae bacterium]
MTAGPGVALIGAGFMGEVHARAVRAAGLPLVGVTASTPERSALAAARLGVETAYPDAAAVLADERVAIVHVLTPNAGHHRLAAAALAAGKHVVCEKPLATSVADAADLVARASASGLVAAVPFVYRFHPLVREMRARVRSGAAGPIASAQGAYLQDWLLGPEDDDWRVDPALGGPSRAFGDIGSHLCDLLEFTTGERITRLQALSRTVVGERPASGRVETEDLVGVLAELDGGAVASLLVSQLAPGRKNALVLELHGSAESLRFEQEQPEQLWIGRRDGSRLQPRDPAALCADAARLSTLPAGHPMGYQDAVTAFVRDVAAAVAGAPPEGLPLFADGERAARITAAVLASAGSGGWSEP